MGGRVGEGNLYVFLNTTFIKAKLSNRYGWSKRGKACITKLPFARGKRISILAALDVTGFVAWEHTEDTFTRGAFHAAFLSKILPLLQPWPLPRSILILDNARIHQYPELEDTVHSRGAILLFLPPYSPDLNPIELGFGDLKWWISKYANLVWPHYPVEVLPIAMRLCIGEHKRESGRAFTHCGYGAHCVKDPQKDDEDEISSSSSDEEM